MEVVDENFFSVRLSSASSDRFCSIRGPKAGARGSPPDESCDELEPALRFSGSLPTSTRAESVVVDIVFSMRRSGGEYCVQASTVRLTTGGSGVDLGGVGGGEGGGLTMDVVDGGCEAEGGCTIAIEAGAVRCFFSRGTRGIRSCRS